MDPVMIACILIGGFLTIKVAGSKASPSSATANAPGRPKGTVVAANPQTSKSPGSAQSPRADQGNSANQPWYTGPLVAGAGIALTVGATALSDYFNNDDPDPDWDAADVDESWDQAGGSGSDSSSNDESYGDWDESA